MKRTIEGAVEGAHGMQRKNQEITGLRKSLLFPEFQGEWRFINCHDIDNKEITVFEKHSLMKSRGQWVKEWIYPGGKKKETTVETEFWNSLPWKEGRKLKSCERFN